MDFKTEVRSDRGEWNYHALPDGSIRFQKHLRQNKKIEVIEANGPYWLFGFITLRGGVIEYPQKNQEAVKFSNTSWAVFFPPHSFAKSRAFKAHMDAEGFWSQVVLPTSFSNEPIIMPLLSGFSFPKSVKDVVDYLQKTKASHRDISFCPKPSSLANRGRILIERSFHTNRSLAEIAKELKTSSAQLSRSFKTDYEKTPGAYRNHLRVRTGVFQLLTAEASIINVGENSGFQDHGRFYKAVKKHTSLTPGMYRKRQKI